MSAARDSGVILAELGRDLHRAWRRPPRRSRLAGWRRSAVVVLAMLVLVPTALAARRDLGAGAGAAARVGATAGLCRAAARGRAGLRRGRRAARRAVAAERLRLRLRLGTRRRRLLQRARWRGRRALRHRAGCARRRRRESGHPRTRLVQTYFDPVANRTWAFGALPAAARDVEVSATGAPRPPPPRPPTPRRSARAACPRACASSSPPSMARDVPLVTARDGAGAVLLVCRNGRCAVQSGQGGVQ